MFVGGDKQKISHNGKVIQLVRIVVLTVGSKDDIITMKVGELVGNWIIVGISKERANDGHLLVTAKCCKC